MGLCEQIYDREIDPLNFVIDLEDLHGRYEMNDFEKSRLYFHEVVGSGVPLETLARANLFLNGLNI